MVFDVSRSLQPGNPGLCGKVPVNLRGIVATFVGDTSHVKQIDTLGACNDPARPGTMPPGQAPQPATPLQPVPGPESSAPEPRARPGPVGVDPLQPAPAPEPAFSPMHVPSPSQVPIPAAPSPAMIGSVVPTAHQRSPNSMVRLAIACNILQ